MSSQTALVTGGEGDLGKAIASALRGAGVKVHAPGRAQLDVIDKNSVKKYIGQLSQLDLLVCNAGLTDDGLLAQMAEEHWDHVMSVNLKGAFLCAREAARSMAKQRQGHIVFISSFSAIHPPVGQANYASAKAALLGLMKSMAQELGKRDVRVNAVLPGFLETKMTSSLGDDTKQASLGRHVLGRFNTPEAVGDFITFIHHQMPHTSGQMFNLDSRIV